MATLLGAALGVGATLVVSDRQTGAAVRAEERTRRAQVYEVYRTATFSYFQVQTSFAVSPMDHCATKITLAGASDPTCLAFDISTEASSHNAYITAYQNLRVYGTDAAVTAAKDLNDAVTVQDPVFMPYSSLALKLSRRPGEPFDDWRRANESVSRTYEAAESKFLTAMCQEVTTNTGRCVTALATPSPSPS
jgi:hypothetical protein